MDNKKQQLAEAFKRTTHSEITDIGCGGTVVKLTFNPQEMPKYVNSVTEYLSGKDPLTGETIDKNFLRHEFSRTDASAPFISGRLTLCGEFYLHFDAKLSDGTVVTDFVEPRAIRLEYEPNRPYIKYSVDKRVGHNRARIDISSNCWKHCRGKIWVQCAGHSHILPHMKTNMLCCYVPLVDNDKEIVVYAASGLPKPELS